MTPTTAVAGNTSVVILAGSQARREFLRSLVVGNADIELVSQDVNHSSYQRVPAVLVVDMSTDVGPLASSLPAMRAGLVLLAEKQDVAGIVQVFPSEPIAILARDCDQKQLLAAIQAVAAGLTALPTEFLESLLHEPEEVTALEPGDEELTPREAEVLHMMTGGLTNREIASALGISEHTVKFHIASIFGKLGTTTRTETVTEGIRRGLILL